MQANSTDRFLSTLLLAKILVPAWSGEGPIDPAAWRTEHMNGLPHLVVFTSAERMADRLGADAQGSWIKFTRLIRNWPPGDQLAFAVNPDSPIGAVLPGTEVVQLATWAAELGLGVDEPEVPAAAVKPAQQPRPAFEPQVSSGPLLMQKPISPEQLSYYLERGYDRVSGFVHRAGEVGHLQTPEELYQALGLGYAGSSFKPDAEEAYVLRWKAYRGDLYRIPYGGPHEAAMRAMEGWVIERPPFRGNGFAPSETSDVIAEFKVDSARLPHHAELWRLRRGRSAGADRPPRRGRAGVAEGQGAVIRDGYAARWQGAEYEASPDGDSVRLYRPDPSDGFEEVRPGRYRRVVPPTEVDSSLRAHHCFWRDEPFIVLGEHDGWLRVEYTGGKAPSPPSSASRSSTTACTRAGRPAPRSASCANTASSPAALIQRRISPVISSGCSRCGKWPTRGAGAIRTRREHSVPNPVRCGAGRPCRGRRAAAGWAP